jgi:serine/threonine-protein kinase
MIGEYQVTGVIGKGGMGVVFAAIHPRIRKKAAIKILQRDFAVDPSAIVRFENEARAVNAIGHPNLVDIFAFGELPNGDPYYVMEHVDGTSLHEWLRSRGQVSLDQAMPILRQICSALAAVHERGIVHRDLKPGNIMIGGTDAAPRVKVLDFGIAKMARDDTQVGDLTKTGVALGTPAFMSPEQFMGSDVDQRADVYALGVVVYRMLCGCYPFQADTPSEIEAAHMFHTPNVAHLPKRVDRVVNKALAKDACDRYSSVREFCDDLERCIAEPVSAAPVVAISPVALPDEPTLASPAPEPAAATPVPVRASRRLPWIAAAGAVVGIVSIAWIVAARSDEVEPVPVDDPRPPPSIIEQPAPKPPDPPVVNADRTKPDSGQPPAVSESAPPAPIRRFAKPKPVRTAKPKPTPSPDRGSAVVDDDRMLLEGGAVKKAPK